LNVALEGSEQIYFCLPSSDGLIICSLVNLATPLIPSFKYSNVKLLSTLSLILFSLKSKVVNTLFRFCILILGLEAIVNN